MTKVKKDSNTEQTAIKLLGQTLQFVWKTGAVKIFAVCMVIIAFSFFAFSFMVPPLFAFKSLLLFFGGIVLFLMWLIHKSPELFQDSGTWFDYKQLMIGRKETGLYLPSPQSQLAQPVLQTQNNLTKAEITTKRK